MASKPNALPTATAHSAPTAIAAASPLTRRDVARITAINNGAVIKEICDVLQQRIAFETSRQARLDAKAGSLLSGAGLTLTVGMTYGVQFLSTQAHAMRSSHPVLFALIVLLVVLGVLAGLAASGIAVFVLRVREGYLTLDERAIFNERTIEEADVASEQAGLNIYRRDMLLLSWEIWQAQESAQNEKAARLKQGQTLLLVFLIAVAAIGLLTGFALR